MPAKIKAQQGRTGEEASNEMVRRSGAFAPSCDSTCVMSDLRSVTPAASVLDRVLNSGGDVGLGTNGEGEMVRCPRRLLAFACLEMG